MAAKLLREANVRLVRAYRTAPLGNKSNPLDELVYIQLSIRTREEAYQAAYGRLRRAVGGAWARLLELPDGPLLDALTSAGMSAVKLARLRGIIRSIRDHFGRVTLAELRGLSDAEAEVVLTGLPGVGTKVARCVLLYSLGRSVFPVDSHCFRVLGRLGLVPDGMTQRGSQDYLQELVPPELRHDLHINLVHHGRAICIAGRPRCEGCVLHDLCPTGQELTGQR